MSNNTVPEKTSYDMGPFATYQGHDEHGIKGDWLVNVSQTFLNQLLDDDQHVIGEAYDETSFAKSVIRGIWLDPATCEYTVCSEIISDGAERTFRFLDVRAYQNLDFCDQPSMLRGGH